MILGFFGPMGSPPYKQELVPPSYAVRVSLNAAAKMIILLT